MPTRLSVMVAVLSLISPLLSPVISSQARIHHVISPSGNPDTTQVLFVGASYFSYNNLPKMYEELVKASGKTVAVTTFLINGTYLEQFAQNPEVVELIRKKQWDAVFLHESGPPVGYPETHYLFIPPYIQRNTHQALTQFKQMISDNCDKTKMIFLMPWAFEDGLTWISGQTDTFFDMQMKIYYNTISWSDEIGFITAPVGWAWRAVMLERPWLHYLFQPDWNHPSVRGSYLTACVLYSTVYRTSVEGNSYLAGLEAEEAGYFQRIASAIVMENPDLWNIPAADIRDPVNSVISNFKLHQNYPNPFNPNTYITYELPTSAWVSLAIYDILGRQIQTLFEGMLHAGQWTFRWDAKNISSGIYFYRIDATEPGSTKRLFSQNRPMILLR